MPEGWLIFFATVGATALTQAIIAAFVYGKLTERVLGLRNEVGKLWVKSDDHERRISRIEGRHG